MTIAYGIEATKFAAGKKAAAGMWGGKPHYYKAVYEAAALEAGSAIYCFRPVKGLKFTGLGLVTADALGADTTLEVGIVGDTAVFMPATVCTAATQTKMGAVTEIAKLVTAPTVDQDGYEFDGETDVIITTAVDAISGTIVAEMILVGP